LEQFIYLFQSTLKEIHFDKVWIEDFTQFPNLQDVVIMSHELNKNRMLPNQSLRSLNINLGGKSFDFAQIAECPNLENIVLGYSDVISSSITLTTFERLEKLFLQVQTACDIGILPCSLVSLTVDCNPASVSITINSNKILLETVSLRKIQFSPNVQFLDLDTSSYDSFFQSEGPFPLTVITFGHHSFRL
jgi:hypothetical protein